MKKDKCPTCKRRKYHAYRELELLQEEAVQIKTTDLKSQEAHLIMLVLRVVFLIAEFILWEN